MTLSKIIRKATGMTLVKYCETVLKTEYRAFNWRLKQKKPYISEVIKICQSTGRTIHELFGLTWADLIVGGNGGVLAAEVADEVNKMTPEQTDNLLRLLGFYKPADLAPAPPAEVIPEEPAPLAQTPSEEVDPDKEREEALKKLFIKTY